MALELVGNSRAKRPTYKDVNVMFGLNSYPELVYDEDAIRGSIFNILTTPYGSRAFNPEYGSRLFNYVYEPLDGITRSQIYAFVLQAISRWEPRVELINNQSSVTATQDGFLVSLTYRIVTTNRISTFDLEINR